MELSDVLYNLAIEAPSAAVFLFAIWRISVAPMPLATGLVEVTKAALASVSGDGKL